VKVCSTHTKTHVYRPFSRTTRVSRYQKGETNYWSKRQWVAVASAGPYASLHLAPRQITTPAPQHSVFTGRMPFLPPNQQWLKATYSFQIVLQNHYATDNSTDADLFQCRSLDRRCGFPTTISRALARVTATLNLWITYTQSTHSSMTSEFKDLFPDLSRTTMHILKDTPAHH